MNCLPQGAIVDQIMALWSRAVTGGSRCTVLNTVWKYLRNVTSLRQLLWGILPCPSSPPVDPGTPHSKLTHNPANAFPQILFNHMPPGCVFGFDFWARGLQFWKCHLSKFRSRQGSYGVVSPGRVNSLESYTFGVLEDPFLDQLLPLHVFSPPFRGTGISERFHQTSGSGYGYRVQTDVCALHWESD